MKEVAFCCSVLHKMRKYLIRFATVAGYSMKVRKLFRPETICRLQYQRKRETVLLLSKQQKTTEYLNLDLQFIWLTFFFPSSSENEILMKWKKATPAKGNTE